MKPTPAPDRFRLLVESVVDYGIFMLDPSGHIQSWNAGAERMKGYAANEVIGKHFSIFYPQEPDTAARCAMELSVAREQGRFEEDGWRLRKDGTRFWANVVITAVRDHGGKLIGFGKVTRDLTERRRAEEALRLSEERLRLLIASVKDYAIFILDPTGHVATWNPGAQRLKGYLPSEIIGQHFSRFYDPVEVQSGKCEMELTGAVAQGRFEDEGWRYRKDGTRFWANVVIAPIHNEQGQLVGFAKVTRDLSERKQHEEERVILARSEEARRIAEQNQESARALAEELRQARDRAEEATRLKDEFLATVGHELRTPLSAILGWGRLLQTGGLDEAKTARAIDSITRNAVAQSQIIDDLLDVSRIVSGQLRLDVEFIDVSPVINAAADVIRSAAEARNVALRLMIDPEVGVIKGDSSRLQQVLWNLLNNAVKFTPSGGLVSLTAERAGGQVEIRVADTGKGIVPEFLPRVFDRFAQEDAGSTRRVGGLGLGLAIAKHLVELHSGTISAHSDGEGLGATFVVRIPLVAARSTVQSGSVDVTRLPTIVYPEELKDLRVLVVDDEEDARQVLQSILEQGGAIVKVVSSAEEGLVLAQADQPDVIVSDIGMPDVDGYDFIARLRRLPRDQGARIPAVALTAFARGEDRRKALLAGFQNHAAKPVDPQELVMVVANLAGRFA